MARWSCDEVPKYRLEKLSIGFVSVMFGFLVFAGINGVASADTVNEQHPVETSQVGLSTSAASQSSDVANTSLVTSSVASSQMSSQSVVSQASQVSEVVSATSNNEQNYVASQVVPLAPAMPVERASMQMLNVRSAVNNPSNNQIQVSAVQDNTANGGFDQTTWGTLDVSKWQGHVVSNIDIDGVTRQYYQLTGYTGDMSHIIVPNEADLEAAGVNTGGHQVGINADTTHSWFENGDPKTIAFSKTDNKMVKALGSNWASAFTGKLSRYGSDENRSHSLVNFDGANLNVNNVSNIEDMFYADQISDLTSLSNWNVSSITAMKDLFYNNRINNLTPLASWDVSNVINMRSLFENNQISDLQPLSSWRVGNVTDMSVMFSDNQIGDLEPLSNWKVNNVTDMTMLFSNNQISDVTPLTNWKVNNVTNMAGMFQGNQISDLKPLSNWRVDNVTSMSSMFVRNQISDLKPLSNWHVDKVKDMSDMFVRNHISNLLPLSNWHVDKVKDMSDMFKFNPIELADFRQWKFGQVEYLGQFIFYGINSVILTSPNDLSLLNGKSKLFFWSSKLALVTITTPNSISINSDSIDMPTLYATDDITTPAEELAEKLVKQARAQKIADYQKAHPTAKISLITPDPTNHSYDAPAIMANQKYRAVVSNKVTYQFVDDDNAGAKVGNVIIVSGVDGSSQKTDLVLPKYYDLASGQSLPTSVTIPTSDTTVTLHLVHTQYNVVIKYLDLSGSQVGSQTVTGKWGTTKQVGILQIPQNYVLQSVNVPTQVEIQPEDTEIDLVVAPTETYRSFVTSKDADLHRSVTRIITVTLPDKSTKTVVQTVNFGRNAWTNNQTHQVTYSDWQADGPQKFVAYIPDVVSGYVPGVVKSQQVLADSQNVTVSVGYKPIQQAVKHPYIDASGHVYDVIPTGYHVVVGQTPSNGAMLLAKDVFVKPVTVEFVTRTVTIKLPNNHVRVIHQRVRKGTQFGKVAVPHLRGYKIVVSNNASLGRVAADQDMNLTVTFEKL